jgi:hypothetical protein
MDLGFKSNPNMHRGPRSGPFRVRIEAGQMWVAPARISAKILTDANDFMFYGLRYRILQNNMEGRHVGLDFYDLLIEAL